MRQETNWQCDGCGEQESSRRAIFAAPCVKSERKKARLLDEALAVEQRLLAQPCVSVADFAAKVLASSHFGEFEVDRVVIEEAVHLTGAKETLGAEAS